MSNTTSSSSKSGSSELRVALPNERSVGTIGESIDPSRLSCLGELLVDALVQFKTNVALVEADRSRENARLTYREVRSITAELAGALQQRGIGPGDRVAILMSNQSKWLLLAIAAILRGATLVPLDYKLTSPEQLALLQHCRPKAVFIEFPIYKKIMQELSVPLVVVTEPGRSPLLANAIDYEMLRAEGRSCPNASAAPRNRSDIATIVYSSGTGGRPKGCLLSHDAYLEQLRALSSMFPLVEGDRYFSILPTNHAIDFMVGFLGPFSGGATVIHQRTLRPEILTETMKTYQVTHMSVVPLILTAFEKAIREKLDELPTWKRLAFDGLLALNDELTIKAPNQTLSKRLLPQIHDAFGGQLKMLFCGGAFLDKTRARFFYKLGLPIVIGYGLTEASTVCTVNDLRPFRPETVGRAISGVEIMIVDPDAHGVGEVQVRGRTLMTGYLDDPELTAAAFDGTEAGKKWLKTGDRGSVDASGHLKLVGRSKNMIVTDGGKNIYPEDIESSFEGLPCEELVVYATDYLFSRGQLLGETLTLVVKLKGDQNAAQLMDAVRSKNRTLADFKRISNVLIAPEPFPRTASMKVKRELLAEALRTQVSRSELRPL